MYFFFFFFEKMEIRRVNISYEMAIFFRDLHQRERETLHKTQ